MGGQQAFHWGVMFPDFVKRAVGICTSSRTSGHNYAFLEGPIAALTNSIDYIAWSQIKAKKAAGEVVEGPLNEVKPIHGLQAFGRTYSAWLTSAEWFHEKKWKSLGFQNVESWIKTQGETKPDWDANDLLVLARMWQMGDISTVDNGSDGSNPTLSQLGGGEGDDEAWKLALKSITAKVLLLPCKTDQYFRPQANLEEARYLQCGDVEVIESIWGHIAGGGASEEDTSFMNRKLADFMVGEASR
ncbi:hypothetical protein EJ08DRAFT_647398 [Tothia fuscella]|uniref:Homoserine O-acetyltransferase n=1 Tax=Tothia fuscella TaxID=1048955 RepID=A0A9P4NX86_9PEZI|nr:hypothetical protein EJ08DRAFT_647398 [Tothia fuscella]